MAALASTALFALHPLAGEVVYWASCTSELSLLIGLLITFIGVLAANDSRSLQRAVYMSVAIAGLLLGLLSKETGVVIAPILSICHSTSQQFTNGKSRRLAIKIENILYLGATPTIN